VFGMPFLDKWISVVICPDSPEDLLTATWDDKVCGSSGEIPTASILDGWCLSCGEDRQPLRIGIRDVLIEGGQHGASDYFVTLGAVV
jgi:hypothetical protein